jgi:hypothetical protein
MLVGLRQSFDLLELWGQLVIDLKPSRWVTGLKLRLEDQVEMTKYLEQMDLREQDLRLES